ncbi:hypothetical protein D3C81_1237450 [compost metagenome]
MWLGQFGSDQRAFELLDLFAEVAARHRYRRHCRRWRLAVQGQFQAKGETLGGVLQLAYVTGPVVTQQHGALGRLQGVWRQAMALAGGVGEVLEQHQDVIAAFAQRWNTQRRHVQAVIQVGAETPLVG